MPRRGGGGFCLFVYTDPLLSGTIGPSAKRKWDGKGGFNTLPPVESRNEPVVQLKGKRTSTTSSSSSRAKNDTTLFLYHTFPAYLLVDTRGCLAFLFYSLSLFLSTTTSFPGDQVVGDSVLFSVCGAHETEKRSQRTFRPARRRPFLLLCLRG